MSSGEWSYDEICILELFSSVKTKSGLEWHNSGRNKTTGIFCKNLEEKSFLTIDFSKKKKDSSFVELADIHGIKTFIIPSLELLKLR